MSNIVVDDKLDVISPNWNAPECVTAFTTTRSIGYSQKNNYKGLNLSYSSGDHEHDVSLNRIKLNHFTGSEIRYLRQNHTGHAICIDSDNLDQEADACYTYEKNTVCCVLTADCVPIVLTDKKASFVAAIHAGWKGCVNNIIQSTIDKIATKHDIIAWIGPCICAQCYNVRSDVLTKFLALEPSLYKCFSTEDQVLKANLPAICEVLLQKANVKNIFKANICTKNPKNNLFSARRDGIRSGRIATCVYIDT